MSVLALKVDVDTYEGLERGVPRLLDILREQGAAASFFVSFGPDRSGLAALQLLRPRFALKMLHTDAPSLYGWRTALSGTLLPSRLIGLSFPVLVRRIRDEGHEVACHAWDHRLWQDWLPWMSRHGVETWLYNLVDAYEQVLEDAPGAFGAPGWRVDHRVLDTVAQLNLSYLSCTRAPEPFVFPENGMLELPSNLPCIEEVGVNGVLRVLEERAASPVPQVLPVHAEVEGGPYADDFVRILERARDLDYEIRRLDAVAAGLDRGSLSLRPLQTGLLPGRAFSCAV